MNRPHVSRRGPSGGSLAGLNIHRPRRNTTKLRQSLEKGDKNKVVSVGGANIWTEVVDATDLAKPSVPFVTSQRADIQMPPWQGKVFAPPVKKFTLPWYRLYPRSERKRSSFALRPLTLLHVRELDLLQRLQCSDHWLQAEEGGGLFFVVFFSFFFIPATDEEENFLSICLHHIDS